MSELDSLSSMKERKKCDEKRNGTNIVMGNNSDQKTFKKCKEMKKTFEMVYIQTSTGV